MPYKNRWSPGCGPGVMLAQHPHAQPQSVMRELHLWFGRVCTETPLRTWLPRRGHRRAVSAKGENSALGQDRQTQEDSRDPGDGLCRGVHPRVRARIEVSLSILPWWCPGRTEDSWALSRRHPWWHVFSPQLGKRCTLPGRLSPPRAQVDGLVHPARPASPLCWVLISIPKHARAQSPLAAGLSRLSLLSASSTEGTQVTAPDGKLASAADCRAPAGGRVEAGRRVTPALLCPPRPTCLRLVPSPEPLGRRACVCACACVMWSAEDEGRRWGETAPEGNHPLPP